MRKLVSWKKLVLVALCIAMVFTLVACGNQDNNGSSIPSVSIDKGQEVSDPAVSVNKLVKAIFSNIKSDERYLNTSFSGDLTLNIGKSDTIDVFIDLNVSIDRQNPNSSKFSITIDKKGVDSANTLLWGAYLGYDPAKQMSVLKVDNRGLGGQFTIVNTDVVYLANMLITAVGKNNIVGAIDKVTNLLPTLAADMVEDGTMKVYEKYDNEKNTTKITATVYLRETLQYIIDYANVNRSLIEGLLGGKVSFDKVISVLNKIHAAMPTNSAIDISASVIGADDSFDLVDGSLAVKTNWLAIKLDTQLLSFEENSANIKVPVDEPEDCEIIEANLGAFTIDIGLDIDIKGGTISLADIDKSLGGVLSMFTEGMNIDFSKNKINVDGNQKLNLRATIALQLDIKDNNNTNVLIEIYFENDGKDGFKKPDPNKVNDDDYFATHDRGLLQISYVGRDQAFYLDLTGLGKSDILPNRLKITEDVNGNPINLTKIISNYVLDLIQKSGKIDFTPLINMVSNIAKPTGEKVAFNELTKANPNVSKEVVDSINNRLLSSPLYFNTANSNSAVATADDAAPLDVMSIVQIVLKGLEFNHNSVDVFNGISIVVTAEAFEEIFNMLGMEGVTLINYAKISLGATQKDGLHLGVDLTLDANEFFKDELQNINQTAYPVLNLGIDANIVPFKGVTEDMLPSDRYTGVWQHLSIKEGFNEQGEFDLMQTVLASLENKSVYLGAAVNLHVKIDGGDTKVNIGTLLNKTIGGELGAAIAELQLMAGKLDMDYTIKLDANIDIKSIAQMNFDTATMDEIKNMISKQNVLLRVIAEGENGNLYNKPYEVISILINNGNLYLDASRIGIPETVIPLDVIFDLIGGQSASEPAQTPDKPAEDPNQDKASTMATVFAIISNIDLINIAEDEIAIGLNNAFINNLLEILLAGQNKEIPFDLTMSRIGAKIDFDSNKFTENKYKSVINAMTIELGFGTDLGGIDLGVDVALGGINIGVVDISDGAFNVAEKYKSTKDMSVFKNPLENNLLNFGLSAKLKINANGDVIFKDKPLGGDLGIALSNLALVLGLNINQELTINIDAAVDLTNITNNKSQLALEILTKDTTTNKEEVLLGAYAFDKALYVNMPLLIEPFKANVDVPALVIGMLFGGKDAGTGASQSAIATGDGATELGALTSLIEITNSYSKVELSSKLIVGLLKMLVNEQTKGENPPLTPNEGEQLVKFIESIDSLDGFDLLAAVNMTYAKEGEDKEKVSFFEDFSLGLDIVVGKDAVEKYRRKEPITPAVDNEPNLYVGLNLGNIHAKYLNINENLEIIEKLDTSIFANAMTIEDLSNMDAVLQDLTVSLETNLSLKISYEAVEATTDEGIVLNLHELSSTLPELLVRLGVIKVKDLYEGSLIDLSIHLALSANIGAIMKGDFNSAVKLAMGIYHNTAEHPKFDTYDKSEPYKMLGIVAMPEYDANGKATMTVYIDAAGLSKQPDFGGRILTGKLKLDKLDLNDIIASMGKEEETPAGGAAINEVIDDMNSIIKVINSALSKISITNDKIQVDLATNIMGIILGLLGKDESSKYLSKLAITGGLTLSKDTVEVDGKTISSPAIEANVKARSIDSKSQIGVGIALSDLKLSLNNKVNEGFIYGSNFKEKEYVGLKDLKQIALNLDLNLDIDMKGNSKHTINLLSKVGAILGIATAAGAYSTNEEVQGDMNKALLEVKGAVTGLHLGVKLSGNIGIQDPNSTFIHLQIIAYDRNPNKNHNGGISDTKEGNGKGEINARTVLDVVVLKDALYLSTEILNFNDCYIPKVGISAPLANMISGLLSGIGEGESSAVATASDDKLDFLIGDRKIEINVCKAVVSKLLVFALKPQGENAVNALDNAVNELFGNLKLGIDLNRMSAYVDLSMLLDEPDEESSGGQTKPESQDKGTNSEYISNISLSLNGLEVSAIRQELKDVDEEIYNKVTTPGNYEEARTNAFAEVAANINIKRAPVTDGDYKGTEPGNIFSALKGALPGLFPNPNASEDDKGKLAALNETGQLLDKVIQNLYVQVLNKNGYKDEGRDINLDVLVQMNLDWNNWQSPNLINSSFRLKVDLGIDVYSEYNPALAEQIKTGKAKADTIIDIYLIGKTNTLYIDAPLLGLNAEGESLSKIKIDGINLIKMIEQSKDSKAETTATTTADDSNNQLMNILGLVDSALGNIEFNARTESNAGYFKIGLAENLLSVVVNALGILGTDANLSNALVPVADLLKTYGSSGIYIKNPTELNSQSGTPRLEVRYDIADKNSKFVAGIGISLTHYAVGVVNDFGTAGVDKTKQFNQTEITGLQNLRDFSSYDKDFRSLTSLQNFKVKVDGTLYANITNSNGKPLDLTSLVGEVFAALLHKEFSGQVNIGSDVSSKEELKFTVAVKIDFAAIVQNLEIGLTIYKEDGSALLAIYYKDDRLYIQAPDYFEKTNGNDTVMRVEHVSSLFGGAQSVANGDDTATEGEKLLPALQLVFGSKSVGLEIAGGVFAILPLLLDGTDINFDNMFKDVKDQIGIGIELGAVDDAEHINLSSLYANLHIKFGPLDVGLRAEKPEIAVATKQQDSILPAGWIENSTHFSEVTFRVKAQGIFGINAKGGLNIGGLLESMNQEFPLQSDIFIGNPDSNFDNGINLTLGLDIDARLCLGEFNKCLIAAKLYVLEKQEPENADSSEVKYTPKELLSIYLEDGGIYVDLNTEVVTLTTLHIESIDVIKNLIASISGTMADEPAAVSSAIATVGEGKNPVVREQTIPIANMIALKFNKVENGVEGEGHVTDLGSITAEIGSDIFNFIFRDVLNMDALTNNNVSAVLEVTTPSKVGTKFGVGLNVDMKGINDQSLLGKTGEAGIYVWLGNIYVVKEGGPEPELIVPDEVKQEAKEIDQLDKQFINLDLTISLAMMQTKLNKDDIPDNDIGDEGSTTDKNILLRDPLVEFFKGIVPWMPEFLAQLDIIDIITDKDKPAAMEDFKTEHAIRIQANVNLGLLLNNKTCTNCGKDFKYEEKYDATGKLILPKCPHCGATEEYIENKEFYLSNIDLGIEVIRNSNSDTEKQVLMGIYVKDSELAFYGTPFGLTNFVISKESIESIAKTVTSLIGGGVSANSSAISTADEQVEEAPIDVFAIINKVVSSIVIEASTIKIALSQNLFSLIPELTKMLGIEGFPQYGYPSINPKYNNIVIGLHDKENQAEIVPNLTINLDMFGVNTQISIGKINLGFGDKATINIPDTIINKDGSFKAELTELNYDNSVINLSVEAELNLNINKADTKLNKLLGGIVGGINADYSVSERIENPEGTEGEFNGIRHTFILRIRGQVNIADYSVVLGVEIIELPQDAKKDANGNLTVDASKQNLVLGIYYNSKTATAYVDSSILSKFKVTGIHLEDILGQLTAASSALTTANALAGTEPVARPVIDHNAIKEGNSDVPSVKVIIALQQYVAFAISGELISQVLMGINLGASLPVLPDFAVGVKIGRNAILDSAGEPVLDENGNKKYDPFAVTLQIGLGDNRDKLGNKVGNGFLIDLDASVYFGSIKDINDFEVGGTYIKVLTQEEISSKKYDIVTEKMENYPTLLEITMDSDGNIIPIVPDKENGGVESLKVNLKLFLDFAHKEGVYDFAKLFGSIFGENSELTALVNAQVNKELDLTIDITAEVSLKYLIMPLIAQSDFSLKDTRAKIAIIQGKYDNSGNYLGDKLLFEVTVIGAGTEGYDANNDVIFLYAPRTHADMQDVAPLAIKIDTINIVDMINKASATSSISTAAVGPMDSIANFVNGLVKGIRITHEVVKDSTGNIEEDYNNINIDFAPNALDNLIKALPILLSANQDMQQIFDMINKLNLPEITDGGLYIDFGQMVDENGLKLPSIGLGVDMEINNSINVNIGLEIDKLDIMSSTTLVEDRVAPTLKKDDFKSISDLQLWVQFDGFANIVNSYDSNNGPREEHPISLGALVSKIVSALTNKPMDIEELELNLHNSEEYVVDFDGYIDFNDFKLTDGKPTQRESKLRLALGKMVEKEKAPGEKEVKNILVAYVDFSNSSISLNLQNMNLPNLKITGLDLAQILGNVISEYIGGGAPTTPAASVADTSSEPHFATNALMPLLYLTLGEKASALRFNADLINGLLQMILTLVEVEPGSPMEILRGLELPDIGQVEIKTYDRTVEGNADNNSFELNIYRVPYDRTNNYLSLGVKDAYISTPTDIGHNDIDYTDKTKAKKLKDFLNEFTAEVKSYPNVVDIENGLQLEQIYVDASLDLTLDFTDSTSSAYSFGRYISRLLAGIIDGKETEETIAKYQVAILGDSKKLQYVLNIKGIVDLDNIFGDSNLAIELVKKDLINGADNDTMLLGAYLRRDDTADGLPTLFVDLNNLGLPRIKITSIDKVLAGAMSTSGAVSLSDIVGTGDYDNATSQAAVKLHNGILIEDGRLSINLNQGFLYSILAALLPDMFQDGYINAGGMIIPLPGIGGVSLGVDLTNGLKGIELKAYLEEDTSNYLGIKLNLKGVEVSDTKSFKVKNSASSTVTGATVDWSNFMSYPTDVNGDATSGFEYFKSFGAVHIGTNFMTDMMNSIIQSLDPNLLIDYQKRSDAAWVSAKGDAGDPKSLYARTKDNNWGNASMSQSWNQIYLTRGKGNTAANLYIGIIAQMSNSKTNFGDLIKGQQKADAYLTPTGEIHASLIRALTSVKNINNLLAGLAWLSGSIANIKEMLVNLTIDAGLNIGEMVFPDASAMASSCSYSGAISLGGETTEPAFDPIGDAMAKYEVSDILNGISIRINTGHKGKNIDDSVVAETTIQVKINPYFINDMFKAVNTLLVSIFDPSIKEATNYQFKPIDLADKLFNVMLKGVFDGMGISGGLQDTLLGIVGKDEINNLINALLPLPELNLNPNSKFDMNVTNETEVGKKEGVRSELNIKLKYDKAKTGSYLKKAGALQEITAEFGNDYGFAHAPIDKESRDQNKYFTDGTGCTHHGNDTIVNAANEAAKNNLGYLKLTIKGQRSDGVNDQLIGFKSVETVVNYNNGGEAKLKEVSTDYCREGAGAAEPNANANSITPIKIQDALQSVGLIKSEIIKKYNLPTIARVNYYGGASTGGVAVENGEQMKGTDHDITIVWDDSRIDVNPNGSEPNAETGDNYLYGWVQNVMIAKIPVIIEANDYELKRIKNDDYKMNTAEETSKSPVEFVTLDNSVATLVKPDGKANFKIKLDSYVTKNLPRIITVTQGPNDDENIYSTTAVKKYTYKQVNGNKKYYSTQEKLTTIYDEQLKAYVEVKQEKWNGKWYISETSTKECYGKLVWDVGKVNWSEINKYKLDETLGKSTVTMKLVTGKFTDFVLKDIELEISSYIDSTDVIKAINSLFGKDNPSGTIVEIDLISMPNFMDVFNKILTDGIRLDIAKQVVIDGELQEVINTVDISKDDIIIDFTKLNKWLNETSNKYAGGNVDLDISINRAIGNPKESTGLETIKFNVNAKLVFNKLELVNVKFRNDREIVLNPYEDFITQMQQFLDQDKANKVEAYAYFRNEHGIIKEPKELAIVKNSVVDLGPDATQDKLNAEFIKANGSLDLSYSSPTASTKDGENKLMAEIKFDVSSIYGAYSSNGGRVNMAVYVGTNEYGYTPGFVKVNIDDVEIDAEVVNNLPVIRLDKVNVLDENTFSNVNKAFVVNVPIIMSGIEKDAEIDIISYDKNAIMLASQNGAKNVKVKAVVGYRQKGNALLQQKGEVTANDYLYRDVMLIINEVVQVNNVELMGITEYNDSHNYIKASVSHKLTRVGASNQYKLSSDANILPSMTIAYSYYEKNQGKTGDIGKDANITFDIVNKVMKFSIGLKDFEIVIDDNVTKLNKINFVTETTSADGVVTKTEQSRTFTRNEDGTYSVGISFLEKAPKEISIELDRPGKEMGTTDIVTSEDINLEEKSKMVDGAMVIYHEAVVHVGPYTIVVLV